MAYVLLWLESLAVSLLFVATLTACIARLTRPRARMILFVLAAIGPLLPYAASIVLTLFLLPRFAASCPWFWPMIALLICYLAGALWIRRRALPRATPAWPRGKLAIALAAAAALHLITFWNLDLTIRQRLAVVRAEAAALAVAVAPARPVDRDNAAVVYERAFERLEASWGDVEGWKDEWDEWLKANAEAFDANDPGLQAFLRRHEPTLRLLHAAAGKGGCYFDHDYASPRIDMICPEFQQFGRAAKLLALAARSKAARGDLSGGLRDVNTMFVLSEHGGNGPFLISVLVAINTDRMAAETLQGVLEARRGPAEGLADVHVEESLAYRRLFQRSLRMEEAFRLSAFASMGQGRASDPSGWDVVGLAPLDHTFYRVFMMRGDMAAHYRLSAKYRKLAAMPYHRARDDWENFQKELPVGPIAIVTNMLTPSLGIAAKRAAGADARRRVVRTALAALRYRARHGRLPEKLQDLVPELLTVVPLDPFTGKPLKWKRADGGAVVYSLGEDGDDDGGAPLDPEKWTGDISFRLPAQPQTR